MQCFHCSRAVRETAHQPKNYQVDYYRLHTGHSEVDYLVNPKQDAPPHRYLRLSQPIDIFTCVECYARPEIRQRLDDDITGRRALVDTRAHEVQFAEHHAKG
ncbi:MAG: hypothetical protein EXR70_12050 [Deltaproteobacteria bacterium]|nr:hypothetical protein [Deltaproteobacteria bacterium]